MNEEMKITLSNPLGAFLGSFIMLLVGIAVGEYWHPSKAVVLALAILAAVLTAAHELLTCFLWCSLTAWWLGKRSAGLGKR
jgi:hypothetical protein